MLLYLRGLFANSLSSKTRRAFTLIEVLTTIILIAIIVSLTTVSVGKLRKNTEDISYISNVTNVQTALNLYKKDAGFYPENLTPGEPLVSPSGKTFLSSNPTQSGQITDCPFNDYTYQVLNNGLSYEYKYCLNKSNINGCDNQISYMANPSGVTSLGLCNGNCCLTNQICFNNACCTRQCTGKNCGDDNCGGSCGSCSGSTPYCVNNNCSSCLPNCTGKVCGNDSCGGSCGTCSVGYVCEDNGTCASGSCRTGHDEDCNDYYHCANNTCVADDYVLTAGGDPTKIVRDSNGILHIIYVDNTYKVYYSKSVDGGMTWASATLISDDPMNIGALPKLPELVVDKNNDLHIFWSRYINSTTSNLRYKKITSAGVIDASSQNLTDPLKATFRLVGAPSAAVNSDGDVFLMAPYLSSDSRYHVSTWKYNPATNTWALYFRSLYNSLTSVSSVDLQIDSNDNFITAQAASNGTYDRVSISGITKALGSYFSQNYVTGEAYAQTEPKIIIDSSDDIHLAWLGKTATYQSYAQVRYRKFSHTTKTWGTLAELTTTNLPHSELRIASDQANNVFVMWNGGETLTGCSSSYRGIYKKLSGGSWSGLFSLLQGSRECDPSTHIVDVIWANHTVGSIPVTGFDFIYRAPTAMVYHETE